MSNERDARDADSAALEPPTVIKNWPALSTLVTSTFSADKRKRPDRRTRPTANLQRRGCEQKLPRARRRQFLQVEAFDDVNPALDEQMHMNAHLRAWREFERSRIASGREHFPFAKPPRSLKRRPGAVNFRDESRRVVPVTRPSGADQRDVPVPDFHARSCRIQVLRGDDKIPGQDVNARNLRDIQQHAAPEERLDFVDRMAFQTGRVCLESRDFLSAEQLAIAGEMAQRVDVRADMCAQRQTFGRRTGAARIHIIAVLFVQSVKKRRMRRVVRNASVIGLGEVDRAAVSDCRDEVGNGGHATSV